MSFALRFLHAAAGVSTLALTATGAHAAIPSASGAPTLGPQELIAPVNYGGGTRDDESPAIATNGTDALLAWADKGSLGDAAATVAYARYSASGSVLDHPMALALHGTPSVAWDGAKYLVLAGGAGQRIDAASGMSDPAFTLKGSAPADAKLTAGGGAIVGAWSDANGNIAATVLDATGNVIADAVVVSAAGAGHVNAVAVAYSNGHFLIAWADPVAGTVLGARVSATGTLEDETPKKIDAGHAMASTGSDAGVTPAPTSQLDAGGGPSGFLVSWVDMRSGSQSVYSARVGADGAVGDAGGLDVIDGAYGPRATWTGSDWWIGWTVADRSSVGATPLSSDGTVGTPRSLAFVGFGQSAAVAVTPQTHFLAWQVFTTPGADVHVERFASDGTTAIGSSALVSSFPLPQTNVSALASSNGYLAGWLDNLYGRVRRYTSAGVAIDVLPIAIQGVPLAALGSDYVIAGGAPISLQRLSGASQGADGGAPGTTTFATLGVASNEPQALAGACMSDRCLIAWVEQGDTDIDTYFAVVGTNGSTIAAATLVGHTWYANAATDGASFLLSVGGAVYPISTSGVAGTSQPIGGLEPNALVAGGGYFLLLETPGNGALRAVGLDSTATTIGTQSLFAPLVDAHARAAWDGRAFLTTMVTTAGATLGAEVSSAPDASAPTGTFDVSASGDPSAVASNGAGGALIVSAPKIGPFSVPTVVARWVTIPADASDAGVDAGDDGGAPSVSDGGAPDATIGAHDAGPSPAPDSGEGSDAGASSPDSAASSGCGCTVAGAGAGDGAWECAWLLPLMGMLVARRRRVRVNERVAP